MQLTEETGNLAIVHHRPPYPQPDKRTLVSSSACAQSSYSQYYGSDSSSSTSSAAPRIGNGIPRERQRATRSDTQELHHGTSETEFVHTVPRVERVIYHVPHLPHPPHTIYLIITHDIVDSRFLGVAQAFDRSDVGATRNDKERHVITVHLQACAMFSTPCKALHALPVLLPIILLHMLLLLNRAPSSSSSWLDGSSSQTR